MQDLRFTLDLVDLVAIILATSGLSVVIYSEWGVNR
jgi:hypothetical protein